MVARQEQDLGDDLRGFGIVVGERQEKPAAVLRVDGHQEERNHVHVFELRDASQLEGEFADHIGAAYRVGCQEHLER